MRRTAILLCVLTLVAGPALAKRGPSLEQQLEALGLSHIEVPFDVTPEMVEWAMSVVPIRATKEIQINNLLVGLQQSKEINLQYDSRANATAKEAFATGEANCLSFTFLIVGLAKELGLELDLMKIEDVLDLSEDGDLVVIENHVTAAWGPPLHRMVLEFTPNARFHYKDLRPLTELQAIALYYSNLGADAIREDRLEDAAEALVIASKLDPTSSTTWTNLGVARRRLGQLDEAELAYKAALEVNPLATSAHHNLAALLAMTGREDQAIEILEKLEVLKHSEPYPLLALGDIHRSRGELDQAEHYYRQAGRSRPGEAAHLAALGEIALDRGDQNKAERYLRRARRREEGHSRVQRLSARLAASAMEPEAGSGG
jgi:Flp pilus assembly protein TadD